TQSALNLVEDERDVALFRERTHFTHEARVEHAHATLTLYRLENQRRRRLCIERGGDVVDVALEDRDAPGERTERNAIVRTVGRSERPEQTAVERAAQREDLVLRRPEITRPATRELERALVRFGARVTEEHFVGE